MDIYCTVEERYVQAVEELKYGETARALQLFNELIVADASYARAYYQLGIINYYHIRDYHAAGYFFSKCIEIEANFPDVYHDFIKLLVFLNMEMKAKSTAFKALLVPGINHWLIYKQLGLLEEKNQKYNAALSYYKKAYNYSLDKEDAEDSKEDIERVGDKISSGAKFVYSL